MLTKNEIDTLRDIALEMEAVNLNSSYELMKIASKLRPNGPFIKQKLKYYEQQLNADDIKERIKLKKLVDSKEIAIIPIGFRCHTKMKIAEDLGIQQASLPFDSGFFPPKSIESIFKDPKIELSINSDNSSHAVCKKNEAEWNGSEKSITFKTMDYDEIIKHVKSKDQDDINQYLDSTFGFYTLDKKHKFVLAHYNWHFFADEKKSNGLVTPEKNLPIINSMMNKRIERMFNLIENAKVTFFIFYDPQNFANMKIDKDKYQFSEIKDLNDTFKGKIKSKFEILTFNENQKIKAKEILDLYKSKVS